MSVQTLYTAATGMDAMQTKLDVVANNLANINTTAFKRDRANFEDLLYRNDVYPGMLDSQQNPTAVGTQVGLGARLQSTQKDYTQGALQQTGRNMDLAIEGSGFFQVMDPQTQQPVFTRAGNLNVNANGNLVIGSAQTGRLIEPPITLPPDWRSLAISPTGQILITQPNNTAQQQIGQLQLAQFINPDGLKKIGEKPV